MIIRPATPADKSLWQRMRQDLWPDEGGHAKEIERFFTGELREPLEVLLAVNEEGRAIGFIELSIRPYAEGCSTDRVAFIEGWYVEPASRGHGIGAALVAAAEAWGRSQGCVELGSDTEVENTASTAAHHALGFKDAGVIRCFIKLI
jgi:aminoglycoside 6'-N-acetyltransferase I